MVYDGINGFPNSTVLADFMVERASVAPTNEDVNHVTCEVISNFQPYEPVQQYVTHDMVGPDNDPDASPIDFLNAQETCHPIRWNSKWPFDTHAKPHLPLALLMARVAYAKALHAATCTLRWLQGP